MKQNSCLDDLNSRSFSSLQSPIHKNNVFSLLARREMSPCTKCWPRREMGETSKQVPGSSPKHKMEVKDSRRVLSSWVEAESLRCLSARYCALVPSPRSTIAAAFSPDGKIIASTHGDHTVKIIDCQNGRCKKVLSGHRRTPWVVRFHPLHPEIFASGSLDHEVRLWNASTSECLGSRDFYRPIASLAFHAEGELLAIAAGHKLYLWQYNSKGEASSPSIVLRTRRSLRAVHFHPHSAPLLLTAEVNDLDSCNSTMAPATSLGFLHYPPPTIYIGPMRSMDCLSLTNELHSVTLPLLYTTYNDAGEATELQHQAGYQQSDSSYMDNSGGDTAAVPRPIGNHTDVSNALRHPSSDQSSGDLPSLQGWFAGQSQSGIASSRPQESSSDFISVSESGQGVSIHDTNGVGDSLSMISRIQSQLAASLAATAAAELPCTVKLRVWSHDLKNPCALLKYEKCRLTISHAVLCSEMGSHFSPCGRFLVACVACMLPQFESDPGLLTHLHQEVVTAATSPTRHSISSRQVMYELRVYSLEDSTFGSVLISRPIRAAHCLTSIQFSPTSEHILLAYGRRHSSLLKSIVTDGETSIPIYTVLEVYRVSDMELVSVLPSAEDEVNVACFHPLAGGGLVYGTKEGKLRILQHDGACRPDPFPETNAVGAD